MFFFSSPLIRLGTLLALAVAVATLKPVPVVAQEGRFELSDLRQLVRLYAPAISPSGHSALLITERTEYGEDRYDRSMVRVDLDTGAETDLTPERSWVDQPSWSPSGDRIAFLAEDDEGVPQFFVLPAGGGEARQLTDGEQGIQFYAWSPDGRSIAFGRTDKSEDREGEERHNRSFEVHGAPYLIEAPPRPTQLWRVSLAEGEPGQITDGPESVEGVAWSADSGTLALLIQPSAHVADKYRQRVELLDLASGERRTVARGRAATLAFSPSGDRLAVSLPRGDEPYLVPHGVFVSSAEGDELHDATRVIDRDLASFAWLPDGSNLLVAGPDRTSVGVWLQPLDGIARQFAMEGVEVTSAFTVSDEDRVAFTGRTRDRPEELYVMEAPDWAPRRVTTFNSWAENRTNGRVETVTWKSADGFQVDGVLTYPPEFREERRYPLVLAPHGGPDLTDTEGFNLITQLFAACGWFVFQPNYRGSNSQGHAFQHALLPDVMDGPSRDIMDGLEALKAQGILDTTRIAVSGWSYGGMLTAWLTAHHQGWAAAVVGQATTDWVDDYAHSIFTYSDSVWFGGSPYVGDNADNYRRQSPITHVHRTRTPTLILSTTRDVIAPITSSFELYHALKDNGVEVKFVAYPGGGHWPSEPVQYRDLWRRWIGWIEEHFHSDDEDVE